MENARDASAVAQPRPLRLTPDLHARPWGGGRFGSLGGEPVGEVWVTGDDARLADGRTLGESGWAPQVPLVKLLDVGGLLSVQVHPDDGLARELAGPNAVGKHELWVVLEAEPGAGVYLGLAPGASPDELFGGDSDRVRAALRSVSPRPGAVLDVPPGAVHAPGSGLVLYEIQQRSDLTYRIWDWGRPRPIHLEEARRALRPGLHPEPSMQPDGVARAMLSDGAAPFRLERLRPDGETIELTLRSPGVLSVIAGTPELGTPGADAIAVARAGGVGRLGEGRLDTADEIEEIGPLEAGSHWLLPVGDWTLNGRGEALVASFR